MAVDFASFLANIPSPVRAVEEGVLLGQQQADRAQAQRTAREAAVQQKALNDELLALSEKEDKTPEDFLSLMTRFPQLADKFKAPLEALTDIQQQTSLEEATNVFAALEGGQTDIAINILKRRKEAAEAAGDTQEATKADIMIQTIEANPDAARTTTGLFLAQALGPERFQSMFDAVLAQPKATHTDIKEIAPGKFSGVNKITGVIEDVPSILTGLTSKEIEFRDNKSKLQFEQIEKMIKDIKADKRVDNFIQVQSSLDRVNSASPTAAGDLSLVFSFMKMLDPGSVVREGEQALARNAAGVPERIRTTYNNLLAGESLAPAQRKDFRQQALAVFDAAKKTADEAVKPAEKRAKATGLKSKDVREAIFGVPKEVEGLPETEEDLSQLTLEELIAKREALRNK